MGSAAEDSRVRSGLRLPVLGRHQQDGALSNSEEVLRLLDSCQLTSTHKVATPVNWKHGQDVIILPAVSDAEAKKAFPGGWKAPKPYMRVIPQPK